MTVEIGAMNEIYCPVCNQIDSFDELDCDYDVEDDILRITSSVECDNCGSSFIITQRYTLNFLDCNISRPKKKKIKTVEETIKRGSCPYGVVLCTSCPYYNTELCPRWADNYRKEEDEFYG